MWRVSGTRESSGVKRERAQDAWVVDPTAVVSGCAMGSLSPNRWPRALNPKEDAGRKRGVPLSSAHMARGTVLCSFFRSLYTSSCKSLLPLELMTFSYRPLTFSVFGYLSINWFLSHRLPCLRKPMSEMPYS